MDSLSVGGSIIGSASNGSGLVFAEGEIGSVVVKNDLIGSTGDDSGAIFSNVGIKNFTINGNVMGGSGLRSGYIATDGLISGTAFVGGDILGGTGERSGSIAGGGIFSVRVGGSLIGGAGKSSGFVQTNGDLFYFSIGGNLIGSSGEQSGMVSVGGEVLKGSIGFDIFGGSISGSQSSTYTGAVIAGKIGALTIGGSIFAGQDNSSGSFLISGGVVSRTEIGTLTIKGSVVGANGVSAFILAKGAVAPTATSDIGIGKLNIGGRVEGAIIGAGYDFAVGLINNGNAQIGTVTVGGDWIASTLLAGIRDTNGDGFGGTDDSVASDPTTGPIASIASITIKGDVIGSAFAGSKFGFLAQQIGKFKAANAAPILTAGKDAPVTLNLITKDIFLREI